MPLSVEELVAQRKAAAPAARPHFVSKKEREQHRAAARAAENAAEEEKLQRIKKSRVAWASGQKEEPHARETGGDVQQRSLGVRAERTPSARKMRRSNDPAKRFQFEWDADDDTSEPNAVLACGPDAIAPVLSARAGMDGSERSAVTHAKSTVRSTLHDKPWQKKTLAEMRERDWRVFREDYGIATKGTHIPHPLRSWEESAIPPRILSAIRHVGYSAPSPIQRQAIPIGLENRDLIGVAETGSGKTASFVIPMLAYVASLPTLNEDTKHLGPYALVLSPTRELAQQIETETRKFVSQLNLSVVSIVGGRDVSEQVFHLQRGAEIVIATPGRLKDLIEQHIVLLSQCRYLVMDEADRMVDMNYEEALEFILANLPPTQRVTMLYSATMPPLVEKIARSYLHNPATVLIGNANQAVGTVEQRVEFVDSEAQRKQRLLAVLDSGFVPPMIVFVNQKTMADQIGRELRNAGWRVAVLHAGLSQPQREAAIASVREARNEILCCTDVGARGIDLASVSCVINYQFPTNFPSYIHRIGRTGRVGKHGVAVSFLDENDAEHFPALRQEIAASPVSTMNAALLKHMGEGKARGDHCI
ncbi:RNA helicase [Malassezia vespertilionis]|uniref:RNA helicase n=1 Tax=Malassezia vespertilionis TaxID=2020962 RepID=A0A2N1JBI9_9BASI|nr:RNA helicase [Malassezia vespertilionis]PKI83920.1 Prp28p [Malassezia vespertilionis]WFD07034.1 RNA helicase [Malassezia vespertilionis]